MDMPPATTASHGLPPTALPSRHSARTPPSNQDELAHYACAWRAGKTTFTAVVPKGMSGSLSYAQLGEPSDAFMLYLRQVCSLEAGDHV